MPRGSRADPQPAWQPAAVYIARFRKQWTGGLMDELAECVRAGKTRFRGISSHHPEVLRAALSFKPMTADEKDAARARSAESLKSKGNCWWNP